MAATRDHSLCALRNIFLRSTDSVRLMRGPDEAQLEVVVSDHRRGDEVSVDDQLDSNNR